MTNDQETAVWIMCQRAALYGFGLAVITCLVLAIAGRCADRWKR